MLHIVCAQLLNKNILEVLRSKTDPLRFKQRQAPAYN